ERRRQAEHAAVGEVQSGKPLLHLVGHLVDVLVDAGYPEPQCTDGLLLFHVHAASPSSAARSAETVRQSEKMSVRWSITHRRGPKPKLARSSADARLSTLVR